MSTALVRIWETRFDELAILLPSEESKNNQLGELSVPLSSRSMADGRIKYLNKRDAGLAKWYVFTFAKHEILCRFALAWGDSERWRI
jgi:hypothetical protein